MVMPDVYGMATTAGCYRQNPYEEESPLEWLSGGASTYINQEVMV